MAIAFDAASTVTPSSGTSLSWTHTCTGANRYLFAEAFSVTDLVTGITYNSVAMAFIGKTATGAGTNFVYLYGLAAPTTGANTITITYSGASAYTNGCGASYTGAKQTGQPEASTTNSASATSIAATVTTVSANAWVVVGGSDDASTPTFSGGTGRANASAGAFLADTGPVVTPASTTITCNAGLANWGVVTAALTPIPASGQMFSLF